MGGPYQDVVRGLTEKFPNQNERNIFLMDKIDEMSSSVYDERSKLSIKFAGKQMLMYLTENKLPQPPKWVNKDSKKWHPQREKLQKLLPDLDLLEEVFYFNHGLRFCSQKIRDYVKEGDILDIGAYIGDSAIALLGYTDKKIYSYELSTKQANEIKENLIKYNDYAIKNYGKQLNDHIIVINKGVSDKKDTIYIDDVANAGGAVSKTGNTSVEIDTVDDEVDRLGISPLFIKADVEGVGLKLLQGSVNTIKKFKPVISISIYHSFEEFFGIFEFMKQFPNYLCEFHSENDNLMSFCEISAFFYPADIVYPIYSQDSQN